VDIALGLAGGIFLLSLHNLETDADDTRRYRQIGHAAREQLQLHSALLGTAATNLQRKDLRPSLRQMTWRSSLDGEIDDRGRYQNAPGGVLAKREWRWRRTGKIKFSHLQFDTHVVGLARRSDPVDLFQ
jgi:hypothetical protein